MLGAYKEETRAEISSSVTETHQITRAMRASRFSNPSSSSRAHTGAANARSNDPPAHRPPSPNLIQARNLPHRIHRETTVDATSTPVPPSTPSPRKHSSHPFVPHRASSRRRPRHHPRASSFTRPSGLDPERPRMGDTRVEMHPSVRRGTRDVHATSTTVSRDRSRYHASIPAFVVRRSRVEGRGSRVGRTIAFVRLREADATRAREKKRGRRDEESSPFTLWWIC